MSTLEVDKIQGVTTAGSISVTGEGNSTTTNLQQGLCKAFEIHDDDETTLIESLNMSSITDGGTGICSPVFANNMATANYFTSGSTGNENTSFGIVSSVRYDAASASTGYTYRVDNSANSPADRDNTMSCNHGDLA